MWNLLGFHRGSAQISHVSSCMACVYVVGGGRSVECPSTAKHAAVARGRMGRWLTDHVQYFYMFCLFVALT